eukprot:12429377-Karenia_brevis.AAC.1
MGPQCLQQPGQLKPTALRPRQQARAGSICSHGGGTTAGCHLAPWASSLAVLRDSTSSWNAGMGLSPS